MTNQTPEIQYVLAALKVAGTDTYVFQRRDNNAPTGPGLLNLWGGTLEEGETADEAMVREISEETSLDPNDLGLTLALTVDRTSLADPEDMRLRRGHLYEGTVLSSDFDVHEGAGSETYTLVEAVERDDLTLTTRMLLQEWLSPTPK